MNARGAVVLFKAKLAVPIAKAAVAQLIEHPKLRTLKEVQLK